MTVRITRRGVLAAGSLAPLAAHAVSAEAQPAAAPATGHPVILTSWGFGAGANKAAWPLLADGGSALDAIETAINTVELLPDEFYVGFGGSPNSHGETTLDAMILWGPTHDIGAVGCLRRVKKAISVARAVMEETQHTLIVGDDATAFAAARGFEETSLTNAASLLAFENWAAKGEKSDALNPEPIGAPQPIEGHDTVGSIAFDQSGRLCVGCSTNGRSFKLPGRVGDSPIAGAGAYGDQDVGGAIATGNGDVMMRFLPTYHTVELMRTGMDPDAAAAAAIKRITDKGYQFDGAILALRRDGAHGGAKAGWSDTPVPYAVTTPDKAATYKV